MSMRPLSSHNAATTTDLAHESALLHVTGTATYVDDIPEIHGTLHGAFGLAQCAHGRILSMNLDAVRAFPGVVDVITANDIPGENNCGPSASLDDYLLTTDLVQFYGQTLFLVIATSHDAARRAALMAKIEYERLPAILDVRQAVQAESWVLPPVHLSKGNVEDALTAAPHRIQGACNLGGQEHFYLEGQIAYAQPREQNAMHIWASTQHPTEMQHLIAHLLGWGSHQISVECRRMGGAFGGKESQSGLVACAAALGAWKREGPSKFALIVMMISLSQESAMTFSSNMKQGLRIQAELPD